MKPEELVRHELIGLEAVVAGSSNPSQRGLSGRVVDESRNTLSMETAAGVKVVQKAGCVFSFTLPSGGTVRVDGDVLVGRPEDRIKKRLRNW
jgi:ribonuclease P protein subunit POP4